MDSKTILISADQAGSTLAAILRAQLAGISWSRARRLIEGRRVRIGEELCLDGARRVREGESVQLLDQAVPSLRRHEAIVIRYVDEHVVVVEKPSGIATTRHPSERDWSAQRKALHPTVEDEVPKLIQRSKRKGQRPRMRIVHRLDKETSGLLVLAWTVLAERELGRQFRRHTVVRRYLAVIPGWLSARSISTRLVRDRGDGRRGSTIMPRQGKKAITHVEVIERLGNYAVLSCRLETGRTHQIRIHLAEAGHPICGEKVYNRAPSGAAQPDPSGAPRLALHAVELGFRHPVSGEEMHWEMPMPEDLQGFLDRLRGER